MVKYRTQYPEREIFFRLRKNTISEIRAVFNWAVKRALLSDVSFEIVANRIKVETPERSLLDSVNQETVSEWFKHACKEAQVMDFTFHCLRHTFASYMLGRGVPIYKVSKIMGHSTVVVTEQHYGHLDRSVLVEEIKHVEGIVTLPKLEVLGADTAAASRP